jgi:hypothetical protein
VEDPTIRQPRRRTEDTGQCADGTGSDVDLLLGEIADRLTCPGLVSTRKGLDREHIDLRSPNIQAAIEHSVDLVRARAAGRQREQTDYEG